MPERRHREQRSPGDFAPILSGEDLPLIVGGQAVNIWAELYARKLPALEAFAPFTSADADIFGSRALVGDKNSIREPRKGACRFSAGKAQSSADAFRPDWSGCAVKTEQRDRNSIRSSSAPHGSGSGQDAANATALFHERLPPVLLPAGLSRRGASRQAAWRV